MDWNEVTTNVGFYRFCNTRIDEKQELIDTLKDLVRTNQSLNDKLVVVNGIAIEYINKSIKFINDLSHVNSDFFTKDKGFYFAIVKKDNVIKKTLMMYAESRGEACHKVFENLKHNHYCTAQMIEDAFYTVTKLDENHISNINFS